MPVYLPQPECEVDPHPGLRRSGILAGDQASVEGTFPMVADRPRSVEDVARASGAVAAGGRESGNRSGAGVAPSEPVKNTKKVTAGTCVPVSDLPYSRTDVRAVALSGQNRYHGRHRLHSRSHRSASRSEPAQVVGETVRGVAVETGQRGTTRYGLPRPVIDAASWR